MKRIFFVVIGVLLVTACRDSELPHWPDPPQAMRFAHLVESAAGSRSDPWYWLRDDSRSDPDVLTYLEAENAYTQAMTRHLQPLVDELLAEMSARIPAVQDSEFHTDDGYLYWIRDLAGAEYPLLLRKSLRAGAAEEVLLDGNALAADAYGLQFGGQDVSPDGRRLAWLQSDSANRRNRIMLRELEGGEVSETGIIGAASLSWSADSASLFYTEKDAHSLRPSRVWRYWPGSERAAELIYEEHDEAFAAVVGRTRSDRYNYIYLDSTEASELRVIDSTRRDSQLKVFLPRQRGHTYIAEHDGQRWIVLSNWQAPNFRVLEAPESGFEDRERWVERVPHRDDVFIHEFDPFEHFLALGERHQGLRRVSILDYHSGEMQRIEFDQPAHTAQLGRNPDSNSQTLQFAHTSLTTPRETWELDLDSGRRQRIERLHVAGGFEPDELVTMQLQVEARDGARIPVSLVHHRNTPLDGSAPLLQHAYGAYGSTVEPAFSSERLSLLERGFVFAIAHVRGSQALGRSWYEQGRLLNKINTFNDFIDVTRALVERHLVDGDRVFASGASAGGLLVAAVANIAPEDYAGIIARVPFVDVVTTMLDLSIPLTSGEFDEWGNPALAVFHDYMLSYSPYDNVRAQDYPAMLVTAGLWDAQVQYWEPVKWVARLRHLKTDHQPLLLRIDMDAGHDGPPGRYRRLEQTALEYAFLLEQAGLAAEL